MPAPKGTQPPGGSRKGKPNKLTRDIKEMIVGALSAKGGQAYLERAAEENMAAFLVLVGKVLPMDVAHSGSLTINRVSYADATSSESDPK